MVYCICHIYILEKQDELKLPTRITVELVPKDMNTFLKVQEIAQNPRIKCIVPLQKRLSNLISHMSERWRSKEAEEVSFLNYISLYLLKCSMYILTVFT